MTRVERNAPFWPLGLLIAALVGIMFAGCLTAPCAAPKVAPLAPLAAEGLLASKACAHRDLLDGVMLFDSHGEWMADIRGSRAFVVMTLPGEAPYHERVFVDRRAALAKLAAEHPECR